MPSSDTSEDVAAAGFSLLKKMVQGHTRCRFDLLSR